jgi:hypothetical protein
MPMVSGAALLGTQALLPSLCAVHASPLPQSPSLLQVFGVKVDEQLAAATAKVKRRVSAKGCIRRIRSSCD